MNEIFGIPLDSIAIVLAIALALCLAYLGWIAWRRPILFMIGIRNIPRRKAQTTLIVTGLMLSTLIIAASIGTGDTLTYSLTSDVYENLGEVDELVVASASFDAAPIEHSSLFPQESLALVDSALADDGDVDGIMPYLEQRLAVQDVTSGQTEPSVVVLGIDPERLDSIGGLDSEAGPAIDATTLGPQSVVLSKEAADSLDASVGDVVQIYVDGEAHEFTVRSIAEDSFLSGYRRGREDYIEYPGLAINLEVLQSLSGNHGMLSGIAISNAGSDRDGYKLTDSVKSALAAPLTGTGLGVDAIKATTVADGDRIAETFTTIFLVLGLFSVVSGLMLIVLIFTMLAAERRTEMGISRAIGTRNSQLTQQFVSEGGGYAVVAAVLGSILGAGATVAMAEGMRLVFGDYAPIEPHVEPRGVFIAFCLGVVVTFLTIVLSARKVSKIHVVTAIRGLSEPETNGRKTQTLVAGVLIVAGGLVAAFMGLGSEKASFFFMGLSMAALGIANLGRWAGISSRIVYSVAGLFVLVLWVIPEDVGGRIWGDLDQGMEMFFVAGLFMVVGATAVIMQNLDVLLNGVSKLDRIFRSSLPAVRTAVSYPSAAKGRTGLTVAMFSLIVFSIVLMATMSENYNALYTAEGADAGWDVRVEYAGGPLEREFTDELAARGIDTTDVVAVGLTVRPDRESSQVRMQSATEWKRWAVVGVDESYIDHADITFQTRASGYEDDAAILDELRVNPSVAVIDSLALSSGGFGNNDAEFELTGLSKGDQNFEPVSVEIAGADGEIVTVQVIGVIDDDISSLDGLFVNRVALDGLVDEPAMSVYSIALSNESQANSLAKSIEASMADVGAQGIVISEDLAEAQEQESGFLKLIEGFMALGLIVGLAAVGVIAFRSVVERRQQIGMLRAIGFSRGTVSMSFTLEALFVVGIGVVSGTVLGVLLGYNLFTSDDVGASTGTFLVPWQMITGTIVATLGIAMLTTWIPARQASRITPAEALRYE